MNTSAASAARREFRASLRLQAACEFSAVRAATLAVRDWLAEKGLPETDLGTWELALVEAANNAVKYADEKARQLPVTVEISCGECDVEARITDHTAGFNWPAEVDLPDTDSESGRGLFLIKSLTDKVDYLRGPGENVMVLRRARAAVANEILPDVGRLQNRLADAETALTDMTAELASSYESLVALFRYSSELGAHTDLKDFSHRLLKDLMQIAEADCAVLRLISPDGKKLETLLALPGGEKFPFPAVALAGASASVEIGAARSHEDIWFGSEEPLDKNDPLRAALPVGHGVCHAFFVANKLIGTATLGRLMADKPFTAAQVNLLHTFIDFLAIQIVNARLLDERALARVTRRELQIAADIQRSLLPAKIPACPPFELAAACQSAQQVGGDFFDIIPAGDGALLLVIADVMGKGVPAALFAAVLRTTIRSMPQLFDQPGELLATANRTLYPDLSRVDMFVTAKIAYLDPRREKIVTASAGHCPLLVWRPGAPEAVASGQSGFPLGIEPLTRYAQIEVPLPPGSLAMLYTDGLSEARNAAGEMLGEKRLLELLAQTAMQAGDAQGGKQFLLGRLADYSGQAPLADDQTLILIRHRP
jgi:serine phosphatase RsbU (regulator of sigma subunit)/anti-sigma regulatory factor (Ser/Thr protein kinase)